MPQYSVCVDDETHSVRALVVDGKRVEDVVVVRERLDAPPADSSVVFEFCPKAHTGSDARLDRALRACTRPRTLAAVPWRHAHVPPGCAHADSCAYVLPALGVPDARSFFPINWRYAAGFAMVEIEPVLDDASNAALSAEWFMTRQFQATRDAMVASLRGPNSHGSMPGFILPDTARHLAPYAHAGVLAQDPLLTCFRPDFARTSKLRLQPDDYIAFCTSSWANASKETKAMAGHSEGGRHYYALIKYGLPPECVDQLKMLLYCNPHGDAWGKLVARKPFERALETAQALRARFLADALAQAGLKPRRANPHVVDTATDVFDPETLTVGSLAGGESHGVAFYAGCGRTHRATRGMITEVGPDRDSGVLWLHGQPSEKVGGDAWKMPASVNSLPVYASQRATARTLESFAAAGWSRDYGYAKIEPITYV